MEICDVAVTESTANYRERVMAVEAAVLAAPQVELDYRHHFAHGVYAREMRVPAGTVITGQVHLYENLNILVKGALRLVTEDGHEDVSAPRVIVSPPGTKRAAIVLDDCIWITVCATDATTPEQAEAELVVPGYAEYATKQLEERA